MVKELTCDINRHIAEYIEMVESGKIESCLEQKLLVAHVRHCFETEDIYTDENQLEHYISLSGYFPYDTLFPWQKFIAALWLCTYRKSDGMPRWPDLFCQIGRGAGKDGTIAWMAMCLISPYNGIRAYDVDICANNEDQAMRPVKDLIDVLGTPGITGKLKRYFKWTKEEVVSLRTKSILKGRTNSPKGKDGLRSGVVFFNEIHQYENYANINVFTTGLGKKKHPRRGYFTTDGDVRDGPLDDLKETSAAILQGGEPDNGLLPFICKLDKKEEVHDPKNWEKANPSLPYLPNLMEETRKEYAEWKRNPAQLPAFMTKRMNIPESNREIAVTEWENIAATNQPLPNMDGWICVVGVDYASLGDWASVDFHFRKGEKRFDINHSWICLKSKDIPRIKAPWREWASEGHLTVVDDVEISPYLLTDYIAVLGKKYGVLKIGLDNFRYALMKDALQGIGFDAKDNKNVYLLRPSDIMRAQPVISSCFANQNYIWGDNPPLRWAVNNTKLVRAGRKEGTDTGNYYYAKIEGRSRKTDPFMALVAAMTVESELGPGVVAPMPDIGVLKF